MAKERERPDVAQERAEFVKWQATCDPAKVICLDESGIKTNYSPLWGWSKKGQRFPGTAPGRWKNYTMLSYLKYDGEARGMIFEGAVDKELFKEFIPQGGSALEDMLLPTLSSRDVVVMDNLNVHKSSFDKRLFEKKGVELRHTPRCSPEYNPIEMMWSTIKSDLRKAEPRDEIGIWREASLSHLRTTSEMLHNWYKESVYYQ